MSPASNRGSRLEILGHAKFLLLPVFGLALLIILPLGFFVGLVYPPWGHAIWEWPYTLDDWIGLSS